MEIILKKKDYLRIKVIPKSNQTELVEILKDSDGEETIKIRLKAVPEKGKANIELIKFLAKIFNIHKSQISIISGKNDPIKLIKIAKS